MSCPDERYRQIYRSIYRLFVALTALALLCLPGVAGAAPKTRPPTGLTCAACLIRVAGGPVLWARGADLELPNASTTKMITALVTIRQARLQDTVVVSAHAASIGGSGLDLRTGEVYTVHDLLVAMLLSSSNEAAVALAEHVSSSEAAFVHRMNGAARALGGDHTNFVNPHGFDASGHFSSAEDLSLFAQALLRNPVLARIVAMSVATVETPVGSATVENRNPLLESYRGAIGVKTGSTLGAGDVLVAAARRGEQTLIAVAMRSSDAAADARALLDYGFALPQPEPPPPPPEPVVVLADAAPVGSLVFDPAGATGVVAADEVTALVSDGVAISIVFQPSESLQLPLETGEKIGTVEVLANEEMIGSVDALATQPVEVPPHESLALKLVAGLLRAVAMVAAGVRG